MNGYQVLRSSATREAASPVLILTARAKRRTR